MNSLCVAVFLTLGVGYDWHIDEGTNPQALVRFSCTLAAFGPLDRHEVAVEYNHFSSVREGWPRNRRPEDLSDQISLTWRIRLR